MDQANVASRWNLCRVEWQSPVEAFSSGSNILESIKNVVSSIFANLANIAKSLINPFISLANTVYEVLFPIEDVLEEPSEQPALIQQQPATVHTVETPISNVNAPANVNITNTPVLNNIPSFPLSTEAPTEQPLDDIEILDTLPIVAQDKREFYQKLAIGGVATTVVAVAGYLLFGTDPNY